MCFPKNKKGRPIVATVKGKSVRATPTQKKADLSQKKIASAPAKAPDRPAPQPEQPESDNKEKTCIEDKSDAMAISLYKAKKKEEGSGGSGQAAAPKPVDEKQNSPEVFENNAQVVSLNPINVTQIFVDSVVPQTNMSKQHTDIVDQNTLETVDPNMDDMIYERLNNSEEQFPEHPQPRPRANVLQPEDDTIVDNTMSERPTKPSEKRATRNVGRTEHRPPSTPDRIPSVFTPQPPTKSEKGVYTTALMTGKRATRGPISTRTGVVAGSRRVRPSAEYRSGARTPPAAAADHGVDNTCPSHEPLDRVTHRTHRPQAPATEHRTVVQTATPIGPPPVDNTCGSREPMDTATAKKTTGAPPPAASIYTAHFRDS